MYNDSNRTPYGRSYPKPNYVGMRYDSSRPIRRNRVTSGCRMWVKGEKKGLSAWKKTKFGFLSILVTPTKWTKRKIGKNGKEVLTSVLIKVTDKNTGAENFHWGICDVSMSVVKVNGLGWVISTKNGGYVSTQPGKKVRG